MKVLAIKCALLLITFVPVSCNKKTEPTMVTPAPVQPATQRYHLKGRVISIDKRANMLNVDSETIPGFMDAMIMPYPVKPATELDKLSPGDAITGDVVVRGDISWLENIVVTGRSAASGSK